MGFFIFRMESQVFLNITIRGAVNLTRPDENPQKNHQTACLNRMKMQFSIIGMTILGFLTVLLFGEYINKDYFLLIITSFAASIVVSIITVEKYIKSPN